MPDFLVRSDLKSNKLVRVLNEFCTPEMAINAVYPHRQHLATNVRSFLDLVTKHFHAADRDPVPAEENPLPVPIAANGALHSVQFDTRDPGSQRPYA